MSAQQRKDEILAKKAKLAELRRTREQRDKERAQRESSAHTLAEPSHTGTSTPSKTDNRQEVEDLIQSLVGRGDSRRESRGASPGQRSSRPSSIGGQALTPAEGSEAAGSARPAATLVSTSTQTAADDHDNVVTTASTIRPAPPAVVTYNRGVQTTESWPLRQSNGTNGASTEIDEEDGAAFEAQTPRTQKQRSRREREREEELRENLRREIEAEVLAVRQPDRQPLSLDEPARYPIRALNDEEMNAVTASETFLDFVERSSKVIERALEEDYDVLADYAQDGLDLEDGDDEEGFTGTRQRKRARLKEAAQFYDERWSRRRMISDLNFSPKYPELVVSAHTKNPTAPQDPSGIAQVWNLHLHSRPEYTFHATSDLLTAKFSPFHPSLILGGCYSGQVLLWDTRSRSPLPVQKTPLSGAGTSGHTHPVYSVAVVGTQNANNFISCSTDGTVCGWSIDMLAQPQEYVELLTPPPSKLDDLSPTCMAFPPSDPTTFLVGTEEGTVYPCHRYDRAGAKAGVDGKLRYRGHVAPVMSVDFHSSRGPADLGDLFLTSSLDWTVRLWRTKPLASNASTSTTSGTSLVGSYSSSENPTQEIHPVLEFPREDVVYDARWSPQRAGVFALVTGAGNVEVWDAVTDTEMPAAKATPAALPKTAGTLSSGYALKSLNKVAWDDKEGRRLAVGGAAGVVTVFELGGGLAPETVQAEEWTQMKRLLARAARERQ